MKMKLCVYVLVALVGLTVAEEAVELFNKGNTDLSAKMFSEIVKDNPNESVVLSACSVSPILAQLALASIEESHDELINAIGLPNDDAIKTVFPIINGQLKAIKGVELKVANKVYVARDAELNENFKASSRDVFGSDFQSVNFATNIDTAKEINDWVEDQTNHRIKDLVDPKALSSLTRAVLVNAIYFKGSWMRKFDEKYTTVRDFYVTKERTLKLPTMFNTYVCRYGESKELNAKLLEIPYEGAEASFLIVLPNEIDGLPALEENLKNSLALNEAVKNMSSAQVNIRLPKFKIETKINLKNTLPRMGVTKIFGDDAKLYNLVKHETDLYVSEAIQKAFIEVNEEGAEAAAATYFVINGRSDRQIRSVDFEVNRPFYFELRHKSTTLFSGVFVS